MFKKIYLHGCNLHIIHRYNRYIFFIRQTNFTISRDALHHVLSLKNAHCTFRSVTGNDECKMRGTKLQRFSANASTATLLWQLQRCVCICCCNKSTHLGCTCRLAVMSTTESRRWRNTLPSSTAMMKSVDPFLSVLGMHHSVAANALLRWINRITQSHGRLRTFLLTELERGR